MIYVLFITCNTFAVSLGNTSYHGGISAESVEIAGGEEGTTDLVRNTNGSNQTT